MYRLHEDITLSNERVNRVLEYLKEVDFHLPDATSSDFAVNTHARYAGWDYESEDLESCIIGLQCTVPGREDERTFIRMSFGQLMGDENVPTLPVNEPLLATSVLRSKRWWKGSRPDRTGIDGFQADPGSPGFDVGIAMIEGVLDDIEKFAAEGNTKDSTGHFDLSVRLGTLLAGRYLRLSYYEDNDRLAPEEKATLSATRQRLEGLQGLLEKLELPSLASLEQPERRHHRAHNSGRRCR